MCYWTVDHLILIHSPFVTGTLTICCRGLGQLLQVRRPYTVRLGTICYRAVDSFATRPWTMCYQTADHFVTDSGQWLLGPVSFDTGTLTICYRGLGHLLQV